MTDKTKYKIDNVALFLAIVGGLFIFISIIALIGVMFRSIWGIQTELLLRQVIATVLLSGICLIILKQSSL